MAFALRLQSLAITTIRRAKWFDWSEENWRGKSLTAVAIAACEVGHVIQHQQNDVRLSARTKLVPVVNLLGQLSVGVLAVAPIIGLLTRHPVPIFLLPWSASQDCYFVCYCTW